ncbi:GTPase [Nanoarchaeota archaeon]
MNFQGLSKIEESSFYIDVAIKAAQKKSGELRAKGKATRSPEEKLKKSIKIELVKLETIESTISKHLMRILTSFPSLETLPEFYQELIKINTDYVYIKRSLGGVNWAVKKLKELTNEYKRKIRSAKQVSHANNLRKEYYGRAFSFVKQIKKELVFLDESRKLLRNFPSIKTSIFTVCLVGFPNVGKSTLLSKVTPATPEIKDYAFTTKKLNLGYLKTETKKIQFIDTPGTLARFDKMNPIEQTAFLAMKYCANLIVYIYDLGETSYPLSDQKKLFKKIKELDKEIIIYLSKTDIIDKDIVEEFRKKVKCVSDWEELKEILLKRVKV